MLSPRFEARDRRGRRDPEREFDYAAGAEKSLEQADEEGWAVVSIKNDWATVFADAGG